MTEPPSDPPLLFTPPTQPSSAPQELPDSPVRLSSVADGPPTSDDPIVLPSPPASPLTEPDDILLVEDSSPPPAVQEQPFYIEVPPLPADQKALYQPNFGEQLMTSGSAFDFDEFSEIAGEYEVDGEMYYFARDSEGILHRFPVDEVQDIRPDLVGKYEEAKEAGTLGPFDPSASYVHINSRVRLQVHIKRAPPKTRRTRQQSSSSDELAAGFRSDSGSPRGYGRRTSTSGKNKRSRELPFSPKKTRSRGRAVVARDSDADSDSDVQEIVVQAATRRSTRTKRSARSNLKDADFEEDSENASEEDEYSDSDAGYSGKRKPAKKKKPARKRGSRAAYGHFRPIADMEMDEEVSEESAFLRIHRRTCEKCHRLPTHQAMVQAKKKKPGRRKKKGTDEESAKTSWPDWKPSAAGSGAHWNCLAKTQRDEILKAALERDKAEWQAAKDRAIAEGEEFLEPAPVKRSELRSGNRRTLSARPA
ncbi:uncharacterized protein B0H18DRAFT_1206123 [Fomitopsis serialis]|uniref:uncharacterized protein n=1 Tax=Fomitopsis serialis TaxID=139415 RepID=UPI0020083C71|nr:uncharacterized protein B0H18DRAFT_1206123 [Neoantrodia serialis]KAH9937249.1 hypothetical protein B0H18DRAFT_1206123 [Neoantrodia serialis]